ncbi:Glycosyl hydrolase, BNR repeat precursor [Acidisarcina polymorpha]|uniref:Glycosyl hydrolase, BNR repeat n=1 Tax=Acidisarcina polymorpha TaxID=2211140 RepID=A0A2Z5G1E2_9BACT|nr:sialidase family protein [Acidisarcina polymorpha]AXC12624.1 Glycosyl hydrolase, BNR repeat precursor [Acidisarcina polymorpha]
MMGRRRAAVLLSLCLASLWVGALSLFAQTVPDMRWRMIGPFRGGRTRAATGVPGEPNVFYVGQVDGGVWKSTDYGRTWQPIFDAQPSQSIGAIAVAPSNSNIVYVGSGEGLQRPDLSVGDGIYRSADAGMTWQHLGLHEGQQIPALAIDPRDPNRVYAAVLGHPYGPNEERGIFRSTDGGATWKKILYKDANTGGDDIVLDPANPNILYASLWESRLGPWEDGNRYEGTHGGLFKSTDGGDTWKPLTKGLPDNLVQAHIAVAPSDEKRLYATIATVKQGGYASGAGLGVYRSDDAGENWYKVTDDPRPAMKIGGGDLPEPAVDPKNADVVYSASIVTVRSTDGGHTWMSLRGAPGGDDYQNLWINPLHPEIVLLVSDQGALVSVNRGESWSSWYNQPTAQLYHVAVTNTFPYLVCAGQQESGSVCTSSRSNDGTITFRDWHPAGVIEYGYVAPDPLHPEIVYGAGRTEVSKYNMITGQVQNVTPLPTHDPEIRADRTEPILFSPVDQHLLFSATSVLFETKDYGKTWRKISPDLSREHSGQPASLPALPEKDQAKRRGAIYSLAPSFKSVDVLWAGTDDGLVWSTHDHGAHWKNITPPSLAAWSKVTQISASHFDDATAYVSVSRMRVDDLQPYLFRTHDGGATWQSIAAGLPDGSPVDTVREDPICKGLLFTGTETSVWYSIDDGDHWQPLQLNLPHTSMRDLGVNGNDLIVATHGRSFWILDDISPLRQLAGFNPDAVTLFKPGAAYRVRRSTNTDTPLPIDEPQGENPPDGAVIDYSLPTSIRGTVTLEILDRDGQLVRKYASTDAPYATPEQLAKQLIPLYWLKMPEALPASAGMHRWLWDMRATTPTATSYEYPISAVPHRTPREPQGVLALPGTYTVRLTAGGKVLTSPFVLKMDPRVKASPADLTAVHTTESKLAALTSSSAEAALEAHSLREQIAKLTKDAPAQLKESLKQSDQQLETLLDGKPMKPASEEVPGLDDISSEDAELYNQVGQVDAAPTAAQQKAAAHAGEETEAALRQWNKWKQASLTKLNGQLTAAHLSQLDLQQRPETMPQSGDED